MQWLLVWWPTALRNSSHLHAGGDQVNDALWDRVDHLKFYQNFGPHSLCGGHFSEALSILPDQRHSWIELIFYGASAALHFDGQTSLMASRPSAPSMLRGRSKDGRSWKIQRSGRTDVLQSDCVWLGITGFHWFGMLVISGLINSSPVCPTNIELLDKLFY